MIKMSDLVLSLTLMIFTFHCIACFADSTLSSSNRKKTPMTATTTNMLICNENKGTTQQGFNNLQN